MIMPVLGGSRLSIDPDNLDSIDNVHPTSVLLHSTPVNVNRL